MKVPKIDCINYYYWWASINKNGER